MLRTGFDIIPIRRIAAWLRKYDEPVLATVFTPHELAMQVPHVEKSALMAICFAAKEALIKVLDLDDGMAQLPLIQTSIAGHLVHVRYAEIAVTGCWQYLPDQHLAVALVPWRHRCKHDTFEQSSMTNSMHSPLESGASMNLASCLFARAATCGWQERTLFLDNDAQLSYAQADQLSAQLAHVLTQLPDYRAGGTIAISLPDSVHYAILILAALKAGLVVAPLSQALPTATLEYVLQDCRALWLVAQAPIVDTATPRLDLSGLMVQAMHAPGLSALHRLGTDAAFILYTSGSTGMPKGVVHEHKDAWLPAEGYARQTLGLQPDDRVLSCAKLSFAYGLGVSLYLPMYCGAAVVLSPAYNAIDFARLLEQHKVSVFCGIPSMYADLYQVADSYGWRFPTLRLYVSAAEKLAPALAQRWQQRFGLSICEGIGTTELFHVFLSNPPQLSRPGSCGRVVPGYQVDVIGDDSLPLQSGTGLLRVAGSSLMREYLNHAELTRKAIGAKGMFTGDIVHKDEDGWFWYLGRCDDLFKVKGQWVVPANLEQHLVELPGIKEVAVLKLNADSEAVRQRCALCVLPDGSRSREELRRVILAEMRTKNAGVPTIREVLFFDDFPRNAHGKVDRLQLTLWCRPDSLSASTPRLESYESTT